MAPLVADVLAGGPVIDEATTAGRAVPSTPSQLSGGRVEALGVQRAGLQMPGEGPYAPVEIADIGLLRTPVDVSVSRWRSSSWLIVAPVRPRVPLLADLVKEPCAGCLSLFSGPRAWWEYLNQIMTATRDRIRAGIGAHP